MKILIIDKDKSVAGLTMDCLKSYSYICDIVDDDIKALKMLRDDNDYIAVITDTNLKVHDGFFVCSEIRKISKIPVIFISDTNDETDIIRAFSVGCDDFIKKPYSVSQMVARVNGHITRYLSIINDENGKNLSSVIKIKDLKIDKDSHRVYVDDKEVFMPVKEYELLLFLAENPNIVFGKERLFDRVWGMDAMGDSSTVTVHIQRIREKISVKDKEKYIETVWGAGYRMNTE